jgi:hypothetical protein
MNNHYLFTDSTPAELKFLMPFSRDQFVTSVEAFGNSASHANTSENHDQLSEASFSLHLLNAWHFLAQNG